MRIYHTQLRTSKKRGHPAPEYTFIELYNHIINNDLFNSLFDNWVKSGYKSDCKPSIDRINNDDHYKFSNIRLTTWGYNRLRYVIAVRQGLLDSTNPRKKTSIISPSGLLKIQFKSMTDVSVFLNCNKSNISHYQNSKYKCRGFKIIT